MTVELGLARVLLAGHTAVLVQRRLSTIRLLDSRHGRIVRSDQFVASTTGALPTRSIAWKGYNLVKNLVITVQSTFLQSVRFPI